MISSPIDLTALETTTLRSKTPFPYAVVPRFIVPEQMPALEQDFPQTSMPGSLPLASLSYGPAFGRLIEALRGPAMQAAIERLFGVDLSGRPTMVTVRSHCRSKDGKIHTDSRTKLITVLVYMNTGWEAPGGRLRLLRSGQDMNDYVAEVPPDQGTMIAFVNGPNAWHGHESFEGPRRAIQLNWVTNSGVVWREQIRHRISAALKRAG